MGPYELIILVLALPPLYWRIAVQMRDVARRTPDRRDEDEFHVDPMGMEPLED